jgi:hypothetical protein
VALRASRIIISEPTLRSCLIAKKGRNPRGVGAEDMVLLTSFDMVVTETRSRASSRVRDGGGRSREPSRKHDLFRGEPVRRSTRMCSWPR